MGSALQTAPCNSQGCRDAAHHPLSPKMLFFISPDGVKNECVWFLWTRRWGEPWGARGAGRVCVFFLAPHRKKLLLAA